MCISEVIDISPSYLDSALCFIQLSVSHDVLCWSCCSVAQSCLTLCDPIDGSPPGSLVPGILQARTLEWVAISFFNVWKWKVKARSLSHVQLLATSWTAAYQAPPSTGFFSGKNTGVGCHCLLQMYSAYKLNKQGDNIQPDVLLSLFGTSLLFHVQF